MKKTPPAKAKPTPKPFVPNFPPRFSVRGVKIKGEWMVVQQKELEDESLRA